MLSSDGPYALRHPKLPADAGMLPADWLQPSWWDSLPAHLETPEPSLDTAGTACRFGSRGGTCSLQSEVLQKRGVGRGLSPHRVPWMGLDHKERGLGVCTGFELVLAP